MIGAWAGAVFLLGFAAGVWIGRAWQARQPIGGGDFVVSSDAIERVSLHLNLARWRKVAREAGNPEVVAKLVTASKAGYTWTHRTIVIGDGSVEVE